MRRSTKKSATLQASLFEASDLESPPMRAPLPTEIVISRSELETLVARPSLAGLNPEQAIACSTLDGPLMVLAGPGTGKTQVIAHRFRELVSGGVPAGQILVLTFTDKAAGEMEERIVRLADLSAGDLWISTFHSFAIRFMEAHGWSAIRVANEVEEWQTMQAAVEEVRDELIACGLYVLPRPHDIVPELLRLIERAKQEMIGPAEYIAKAQELIRIRSLDGPRQLAIGHAYQAYQRRLLAAGLMDFDDAIYHTVKILEDDPRVLAEYRRLHTHVMVDEFQDTNYSQMRMVELIAGAPAGNILVVGDDDQSIYRFRGASLTSLRRFERVFDGCKRIALVENYRSSAPVVDAATRLIHHGDGLRFEKPNRAQYDGPAARLMVAGDRFKEIAAVLDEIEALLAQGVPAGEIAVLTRTNSLLRPFILALQTRHVPYQIYGGRGYLEQPEIRDLRGLLQAAASPADSIAFARVLSMHGFGLSADVIARLCERADLVGTSLEDVSVAVAGEDAAGYAPVLQAALALVREIRDRAARATAEEVVHRVLEATGFLDLLCYESELERRQIGANLSKFVGLAESFCRTRPPDEASLTAFVAHLQAVETSGSEQALAAIEADLQAVQLMTIHQAKGLEFRAVFLPSWVEERFPMRRTSERITLPAEFIQEAAPDGSTHLAEERRLAYVGLTRAKDLLYFSYAHRYEGTKKWKPSRFLGEIGLVAKDGSTVEPEIQQAAAPADDRRPRSVLSEAFRNPPDREQVLGFSALETYLECPRRFQYAHIYRLPIPARPEAQFGTVCHQTIREVGERARDREVPVAEAIEVFDTEFNRIRFADPDSRDLWVAKAHGWLGALHAGRRFGGARLLEQGFFLRLQGEASHGPIEFTIAGRIDRIDCDGTLIDYKTGAVPKDYELERDMQLGIYAIAAREALGIDTPKLVIRDIDGDDHPVLKTSGQLLQDRGRALEAASGIAQAEFPAKPSTWKCRHCPFRLLCPAAE